MLVVSSRLGPYEIVAPLGAGGMGEVYRARDTRLGRDVAVKVLPEPFAHDPVRRARFEREARAVAALSHPNILAIHDYGTEGAVTYAVMELLEGETLRDRLVKGPLSWREAVEVGAAIAEGLAAAHAKGVVHRDLKPENLFLTADGRVKSLDFGLARITQVANTQCETGPYVPADTDSGLVMGTAGYMSPEQVRGQPADARSDIFSLGCVLYEMVTGRRAFQRETAAETMTAILHDEPPDPTRSGKQIPLELGRIIGHCLAKSPSRRLQSARDLSLGLRATATDPGRGQARPAPPVLRRKLWLTAALVLIGLAGISLYMFLPGSKSPDAGPPPAEASQTVDSLAILPLVNVTGDPKAEPLCDGIADHVSSNLAQVRDRKLNVRPITSTVHYKGRNVDARTVGRELDVGAVVTGRLRLQEADLTITLELVEARQNSLVWNKTYKCKLDEILILQDEIARDVAVNLGLRLTGDQEKQLTRRYTNDPAAYLLFREGRYQWEKGTPESLDMAIKHFQAAIKKDPSFALAYAWQAHAYIVLSHFRPVEENWPRAKESAGQALLVDDNLAEGHAALGAGLFFLDQDWQRAQRELRIALDLDPKNSNARHLYGYSLAATGKVEEAIAEIEQAVKDDPRYVMANGALAKAYLWAKRYQDALGQARKTQEISDSHRVANLTLGLAYAQLHQYERALTTFQEALQLYKDHPYVLGLLGYTYGLSRQREEAGRVLKQLLELSPRRPHRAYGIAAVYTGLGNKNQAIHWLNVSRDNHDFWIMFLNVDPHWESLRNDPRFEDLLQRMGLADKPAGRDQGIHTVAVLPFENVGGDPKAEFLSDGVADQIINSLSQVRRQDLKVRPFTSVARFKGKAPDIPTFGRELNVQMIVTGRLHQQGDDLTVRVALVNVGEDNQLWGKQYQGKLGTILDLQDQIARDVAANLRLSLTGDDDKRLTKRYTQNPEAYQLYLKGRHFWNKRTPEWINKAISYFQQATDKDPGYALAYAGLADCYVVPANPLPPREKMAKARAAAMKALDLDDTLAEAHTALARVLTVYDWDWSGAAKEFQRAIELDPRYALAHEWYGGYWSAIGRNDQSIAERIQAQLLDPLSPIINFELAMAFYHARQYDRAIEEFTKTLEMDPSFQPAHTFLAAAYEQKGMYEKAITGFQKANSLTKGGDSSAMGGLGHVYAVSGKKDEAQNVLNELKRMCVDGYVPAHQIALIYAGLREKDQAFAWLEKAYEERQFGMVWLKTEPRWQSLRSDLRFAHLLQRMRLADKAGERLPP